MQHLCKERYNECLEAFQILSNATYKGVDGVLEIQGSNNPSPHTYGISICTHGDEPVGLIVAYYLIKNPHLIEDGRILITLNNLQATRNFLENTSPDCRFIDRNMNRLCEHLSTNDQETLRAKELLPIWEEFTTGALDIHSTSSAAPTMIIGKTESILCGAHYDILHQLSASHIVYGILESFSGSPVLDFFGCPESKKLLLECGQHYDPNSFCKAIELTHEWLLCKGFTSVPASKCPSETSRCRYEVFHSIFLPDSGEDFYYPDNIPIAPFQYISKGEPIAAGKQGTIFTANESGYAVMAPQTDRPLPTNEELLFLARKIEEPIESRKG